eukprot:TRINITY_DN2022_c0_g1_i2.p1 TRINITY_DN2022_c0_g1~~TRINITY_DN2022_c0_g1_i2.p1  ORF type:complete len:519 (-),score=47.22 TRINITY_DN2022_c0_g1_i2:610-2166(-)
MNIQVVGIAFVLIFLILVYGFRVVWRVKLRKIPGPKPIWLFGNLHEFKHLAYDLNDWAAKFGPVCKVFLGGRAVVFVTDPELARQIVLKCQSRDVKVTGPNASLFREFGEYLLLYSSGKIFKKLRSQWQIFFNPQNIESYFPLMLKCAQNLCDVLDKKCEMGEVFDFYKESHKLALEVVASTAFGIEPGLLKSSGENHIDWNKLMECINVMMGKQEPDGKKGQGNIITPWIVLDYLIPELNPLWMFLVKHLPLVESEKVLQRAIKQLVRDSERIVKTHQDKRQTLNGHQDGRDGFIDLFSRNNNKDLTSNFVIVAQVYLFLIAGFETTGNTLAFAVYLLSLYPHKREKLIKEIKQLDERCKGEVEWKLLDECKYLEAVIKETLRLYPPATMLVRDVEETLELQEYKIPPGTMLWVNIHGIQRDSISWKDADAFIPERFIEGSSKYVMDKIHPYAYAPFGGGTRMCTGYRFATQELKVALYMIYKNYDFDLKNGQVPLETYVKMTLTPTNGIQVKAKRI